MAVKPLSPAEARATHAKTIPDAVIRAVNNRLVNAGDAARVVIRQDELVEELENAGLNRKQIFDQHWLDFEDLFRAQGWKVVYDKPGFNESYEATWTFTTPDS